MTPFSHPSLSSYLATSRRRKEQQQIRLCQRRSQGLALAKRAAQILKTEFGASRVVLFGSVLSESAFHEASDLDLATWDLPPADYFRALARLLDLSDFSIDLVEAESASSYLQAAIAGGIAL